MKYPLELKQKVLKDYFEGNDGIRGLERTYGLPQRLSFCADPGLILCTNWKEVLGRGTPRPAWSERDTDRAPENIRLLPFSALRYTDAIVDADPG